MAAFGCGADGAQQEESRVSAEDLERAFQRALTESSNAQASVAIRIGNPKCQPVSDEPAQNEVWIWKCRAAQFLTPTLPVPGRFEVSVDPGGCFQAERVSLQEIGATDIETIEGCPAGSSPTPLNDPLTTSSSTTPQPPPEESAVDASSCPDFPYEGYPVTDIEIEATTCAEATDVINEFLNGPSTHAVVGDGWTCDNFGASGPQVCTSASGGQILFRLLLS
ncbi:MAG: hypothetical protein U0R24_00535 [Solirubrobacterales bacterium]